MIATDDLISSPYPPQFPNNDSSIFKTINTPSPSHPLDDSVDLIDFSSTPHFPKQKSYQVGLDVSFDYSSKKKEFSKLFTDFDPRAGFINKNSEVLNESFCLSQNSRNFIEKKSCQWKDKSLLNSLHLDNGASEMSIDNKNMIKMEFNISMTESLREKSFDKISQNSWKKFDLPFNNNKLYGFNRPEFMQNQFHAPALNLGNVKSKPVKELKKKRPKSVPYACKELIRCNRFALVDLPNKVELISQQKVDEESQDKLVKNSDKILKKMIFNDLEKNKINDKKVDKKVIKSENNKKLKKNKSINNKNGNIIKKRFGNIENKLKIQLNQFKLKLNRNKNISTEEKKLLSFLMKFLLDFDIEHTEFLNLNEESRDDIKKFIIHRFFKHELNNNKEVLLNKRSNFLENDEPISPLKRIKPSNFIQPENNPKPDPNFNTKNNVNCKFLSKHEIKDGIISYLESYQSQDEILLGERYYEDQSWFYKFEIPYITLKNIESEEFDFKKLQEFLRKRELLSIICRRKQQRERRGKRNDEKTKKIFKKIMKSLLKEFKNELKKDDKKITSFKAEEKFYNAYFGNLGEKIDLFHDPLKKKFKNPKFKSISNDYLAQLKKSKLFVKDLQKFCQEKMIVQGFDKYSEKILTRFSENRKFLRTLDKAKSKFEWVRFELKVAVMHFLFTFQNAVPKARKME